MAEGTAPAGWYPDTTKPGQQRYWDGNAWTDHVAPLTPTAPAAPAAPPAAAAPTPTPADAGRGDSCSRDSRVHGRGAGDSRVDAAHELAAGEPIRLPTEPDIPAAPTPNPATAAALFAGVGPAGPSRPRPNRPRCNSPRRPHRGARRPGPARR